jgi:hypothetical protein
MTRRFALPAPPLLAVAMSPLSAAAQDVPSIAWDGVVDVYYAHDTADPPGRTRAYATEPARHGEFALNLALLRAQLSGDRVRGSVGFALGTYMEANYAAEPEHFRNVFEAWGGVSLGGGTWLDAGILPSHIGFESAITPLNWTWSRSMMAEWSPYYLTGVRLGFEPGERTTANVLLVNGWQNIRETNGGKSLGVQVQHRPSDRLLLNWSGYVGDEAADGDPDALVRIFNDFWAQLTISERLEVAAVVDVGTQELAGGDRGRWYGVSALARVRLAPMWALGLRVERFADPDQVNLVTGLADAFETASGSVNLDWTPAEGIVLRVEGRVFDSASPVWPTADGLASTTGVVVSSLALTF